MTKYHNDMIVANWFHWHQPENENVRMAHEFIRNQFRRLAVDLNNLLPEGPDKNVALRALRDAAMQANNCVAVAGKVFEGETL